jgi:hypothetical protein
MKKQFSFLMAVGFGHPACAQLRTSPQAASISLDTVAVSGRVRQLSLLPPGEKPSAVVGLSVSPGHRVAVRYQPPSPEHEYDIRSVTLHFNTLFNQSSAGSLHVQLALADSSGAPSATYLLSVPFVITDKQVRRAARRTITLAVQGSGLALAKRGVFVVLTGAPSITDRFVADTTIAEKHGKHQQVAYVKVQDWRTGTYRLISSADFLTVPVAHTTELPVTWSFWQRDKQWHRAPLTLPQVPHYRPHNYWVELGVTEL